MPAEIVKQQYIALAKLLKIFRTAPLDKKILKASHDFCKNLYAAAKAHPDLIFAQPQLYKSQLPFIVNIAFNSTVLTCLLAVRNKFDPSVTTQLMCGSLSIYALEQPAIEKYYQTSNASKKVEAKVIGHKDTKFTQLLETNQQHTWLCNYLLCSNIHLNTYPDTRITTPITALAYMANRFALLCTPNKHKTQLSFALAIKHLSLKCNPKWYGLLAPLLRYPSVSPPGSFLRLNDDSIQIVLSLNSQGLLTRHLPVKQSTAVLAKKADIQITTTEQVVQSYPSQRLTSLTRVSLWWDKNFTDWFAKNSEHQQIAAFSSTLPIQTAPTSLLIIQDQLNHSKADIAVIVKAIEKDPTYVQQLQISASLSNRKKQPVQNIQQGLAMLGNERVNSILLQHSLLSRLNQQYFPLQKKLLTFNQFFVSVAGQLAKKTKLVSPGLVCTAANFLVSRLFTLTAIRTLVHWPQPKFTTFKVMDLIEIKDNEYLKNDTVLLAKAWHQNNQILDALKHYDLILQNEEVARSTRQFCYLIGLSLAFAQEYYFSGTTHCKETAAYIKTGLIELGISQKELISMMADITVSTNVFCELD